MSTQLVGRQTRSPSILVPESVFSTSVKNAHGKNMQKSLVIEVYLYEDILAEIEYVFIQAYLCFPHLLSIFINYQFPTSDNPMNIYILQKPHYVSDSSQLIIINVFLGLIFIFGLLILKRDQVKRGEIHENGIKVDSNFSLGKDKEISAGNIKMS